MLRSDRKARPVTGRRRWAAAGVAAALVVPLLAACGSSGDKAVAEGTEPAAGAWKTWVIGDPAKLAVPAPPKEGSAAAKADAAELKDLAGKRTPEVRASITKFSPPLPTKPWTDVALAAVAKGPKNPPLSSRNYALLHVAIGDAVTAAWHWKYEYDVDPPDATADTVVNPGRDPSYPSEHAAIAGAAARMMTYLWPDQASEAQMDEMAGQAADSRVYAGANTRSEVEAGLELGRKVADLVIARGKADGSDRPWDGARPPGIGGAPAYWSPPPGAPASSPPVEPLAGSWKPWVLKSGDQFRAPPPPAFGSPEYLADAKAEVEAANNLTPEQQEAVKFYAGEAGSALPAGIVADNSQNDLIKAINGDLVAGKSLSVPRAVRAMALVTVALADAGIAAWDTKFTYWTPRPENAIHDLGLDKDFKPAIATPRFPAYVSGSSTYAGAVQQVMTYLFPQKAAFFKERAETQAHARLWAGIHFPMDEVGLSMGRSVGDLVVQRAKSDGADT